MRLLRFLTNFVPFGAFFLLLGVVFCAETACAQDDAIFQIGFPDGKAAEFRTGVKWEDYFGKPDEPVRRYVVGESRPREWMAWYNSTRDWKNAGHSFLSVIEFDAEKDYDIPLYFIVATCYGHPTEPSFVKLTINGTDIEPKRVVPGPPGFPKFNSAEQFGWPENMSIEIPPNLVKKGKNELKMRLYDGSWAIFDYLLLREKNEPLPIVKTDDMLEEFRKPGAPMEDVKEVLFAVRQPSFDGHWYANFGYYACDTEHFPFPLGQGGSLRILNLETGETRTIFEDKNGNVRDPQIHYDGKKAIFSYLKAGTRHYNLYEINLDGTGLRQITSGEWDDIEPTYLPNGDIVFPSSRGKRWVQCWLTGVAMLHRCGPNGENIRPISSNPEQENTPWVLPNGQILYMRWEYIDRSQVHYHHLWTSNPDGTKHQIYYGNQNPGICMLGAKPVRYRGDAKPEDRQYPVVGTFSPGHGRREHYGAITLVNPKNGPDDLESARQISLHNDHADAWSFDAKAFLCVRKHQLQIMDEEGREVTIYELPPEEVEKGFWVADVQPIIPREREEVIADTTDDQQEFGRLALMNVYTGRQMMNVPKGTIKDLMIMEPLPIPVHYNGGMMSVSSGGTFALTRFVGIVPVNADGSAFMELPAGRSYFFIARDEKGDAVKRMHSFTTIMPGENAVCIGCHEERTEAPTTQDRLQLMRAMSKPPVRPTPVEGIPEVFDYFRDIVPILDKNCVECHCEKRADGGVNLNSDLRPTGFVDSYNVLSYRSGGYLGDNRNRPMSNFEPYTIGTPASKLLHLVQGGHPDAEGNRRVNLTPEEIRMLRYWIDAGAYYCGTYAADACGLIGWHYSPYGEDRREKGVVIREDENWSERHAMVEVFNRRCAECHQESNERAKPLPHYLSVSSKRYGVNWCFNLSHPEESRLLLSPLSADAGGRQRCKRRDAEGKWQTEVVFKDVQDPDYQIILKAIERGKQFVTSERSHFSIKPFYPNPWYAREMVRYGILPPDYKEGTPIDPYETDEKYWRSLWSMQPR
ncbi:MAG: polysaccharide lyase family protein [Planctomycetia bacterium]|nr:polysaccharide lyase family protein [Planctomycetia bacterium]